MASSTTRALARVISVLLLEAFLWNLWIEMAKKTHYTPGTQLLESSLWRVEQQLYRTTAIGPMFYQVTSPASLAESPLTLLTLLIL